MPTDPRTDPLRFAYLVPDVSGGLVTSSIEQRIDGSFEDVVRSDNEHLAHVAA